MATLLAVPTFAGAAPAATSGAGRQRIALSIRIDGSTDIATVRPDGTGFRRLTDSPSDDSRPLFSADGSQIAFLRSSRSGLTRLMVMRRNGTDVRQLSEPDSNGAFWQDWSPDGTALVYSSARPAEVGRYQDDLFVVSVLDGTRRQLTDTREIETHPRWSPDGTRIVYSGTSDIYTPDFNQDIYTMDVETLESRRLTDSTGYEYEPVWSPDGSKIAFTSTRGGCETCDDAARGLFVMDADGANERELAVGASSAGHTWIDVERIVFTAYYDQSDCYCTDSDSDIRVASVDSGEISSITTDRDRFQDGSPVVAPTGRWIAYVRAGKEGRLMKARVDGTATRKLITRHSVTDVGSWAGF